MPDIVLLMDRMEDDAGSSLTSASMILPSAILILDFLLTRMGNTLPDDLDYFS